MTNYIRKCSLELLAYYYSNTDLEDEFSSLIKLLQDPESINFLINLAKDEVLYQTLDLIDERVVSSLVYHEEDKSDSIFEEVVTDELASSFLYRLAKLS